MQPWAIDTRWMPPERSVDQLIASIFSTSLPPCASICASSSGVRSASQPSCFSTAMVNCG
jgi:hypothetical protein